MLLRALAALGLAVLLAGCGTVRDADQSRLCRAAAAGLYEDDVALRETDLAPVPGQPASLRLRYIVRDAAGARPHVLLCRFAAAAGPRRIDLIGLDTDAGPVSDVRLYILKRWWLPLAPEAAVPPAIAMPARAAYWLQQSLNGLMLIGVYGLVATSFALVHGLLGRVNLAFGEIAVAGGSGMLALMGALIAWSRPGGAELAAALGGGVALAAGLSWVVGRGIVIPLATRSRSPQPVMVGTVALAIALGEFLRTTGRLRETWLPPLLNTPLPFAGDAAFAATVTPAQMLAAGLGLMGAAWVLGLIGFTRFGRNWRAFADDPLMAQMAGISPPRLLGATFLVSGACAGLAGAITVIGYGTVTPGEGLGLTLKALVAAVIGGLGSIPGAFLGAVIVAGVETLWSATFNFVYRDTVTYCLLAIVLVLRPGGLLGQAVPTPREV
ncbi:MAG TPA: branched-chain amino acid ABC transporter permease [Xanthobacteraceae bacterium]|nr:branched-chain amino acid ABC transporter permease [Xanthobacteraceae bacterium]